MLAVVAVETLEFTERLLIGGELSTHARLGWMDSSFRHGPRNL